MYTGGFPSAWYRLSHRHQRLHRGTYTYTPEARPKESLVPSPKFCRLDNRDSEDSKRIKIFPVWSFSLIIEFQKGKSKVRKIFYALMQIENLRYLN